MSNRVDKTYNGTGTSVTFRLRIFPDTNPALAATADAMVLEYVD